MNLSYASYTCTCMYTYVYCLVANIWGRFDLLPIKTNFSSDIVFVTIQLKLDLIGQEKNIWTSGDLI